MNEWRLYDVIKKLNDREINSVYKYANNILIKRESINIDGIETDIRGCVDAKDLINRFGSIKRISGALKAKGGRPMRICRDGKQVRVWFGISLFLDGKKY